MREIGKLGEPQNAWLRDVQSQSRPEQVYYNPNTVYRPETQATVQPEYPVAEQWPQPETQPVALEREFGPIGQDLRNIGARMKFVRLEETLAA